MCRNAKVPSKGRIKSALSFVTIESPDFNAIDNANSFDHPALPIITMAQPQMVVLASWGLIPEHIKDINRAMEIANLTRNAKAETLFEKPSFAPYALKKRCLVFVEGFYEWRHEDPKGKKKTPYYVSLKDGELIPFAGLYTDWHDIAARQIVKTCTVITTASNPLMSYVHNSKERQPLIMPREKWDCWLDPSLTEEQVNDLMQIYPDDNMRADIYEKPKPPRPGELF